jgi:hypothetical protein
MIYDVEKGDRGRVFSNGVEINKVIRVDTETGECRKFREPLRAENGEALFEDVVLENVTFEPL